jgi:GntR family transcriptional regulator
MISKNIKTISKQPIKPKHEPFELVPISEVEGVPLYRQVKRILIKLIENRKYAPGDSLPSESVISNALQVSIGTLRKAVDELVMENVLVRRQGRGTFVAMHNHDRFLFQFFHVEKRTGDLTLAHEYPEVECVSFDKNRANEDEATALGIRFGDPVFQILNKLKLSARPVVFDRITISTQNFVGLTAKQFVARTSTVYNLYQRDFGITVLRAQERARAVPANPEASNVLGLKLGFPVLEVHRLALTFGDKPVEYRISTINTQHYDYVSLLSKRGDFA